MLSRDEEPLLSAYLDGELGDEEAGRVRSAIAGDRGLAEAARGLRAVAELVAELPRPPAPDLSAGILHAVRGRAARRRPARVAAWIAGGIAASAAALAVAWALRPGPSPRMPAPGPVLPTSPPAPAVASSSPAGASPAAGPPRVGAPTAAPAPEPATGVRDVAAIAEFPADRERLRELMDDPSLRRAFLITDRIGGQAESRVASLVEKAAHRDFYKVTVSQGIVFDPEHPGQATVFAVVVDEAELDPLRRGLEGEFGPTLEDIDLDPAVAMQLADIGQVVSLPARGAGDVAFPTEPMALRGPAGRRPTPEQERSSPAADLIVPGPAPSDRDARHARAAGGPAIPPDRERRLVVLLWVRRPDAG
ncbi:hypothetical protein OJF2_13360 [Aquisphaera giovannonii]|uniref:Putative zinc-finger domain-containing protein n=1 Tax=Aquisphaera giovannonii TaxID=406548 RepID=A0A5B9VY64_9BACT|nr:zf-HC2 domain-containing protein [Aquisphaera giovannonii]QEH32851.1 hypothetical protein OJF2_13360 [Aquisphaera giovannonii]